ncbi:MAG: hypothetical protein MUO39_09255 [Steroidobacteraceae bacterium]|nr:hypothetical protein [Steroidobacteraceae bacterium]
MRAIVTIAALYALFIAASGFLFGQLFFGRFSLSASVAGIGGVIAGLSCLGVFGRGSRATSVAFWSALVALIGVAFDAADYYLHLDIPGNYYAWVLIGPFCFALVLIAFRSRQAATGSHNTESPDRGR